MKHETRLKFPPPHTELPKRFAEVEATYPIGSNVYHTQHKVNGEVVGYLNNHRHLEVRIECSEHGSYLVDWSVINGENYLVTSHDPTIKPKTTQAYRLYTESGYLPGMSFTLASARHDAQFADYHTGAIIIKQTTYEIRDEAVDFDEDIVSETNLEIWTPHGEVHILDERGNITEIKDAKTLLSK